MIMLARQMVEYTIAICNYNMARTLEEALRSILQQIGDRFEVLVVDDASTDESVSVLEDLSERYDQLRYVALSPDPNRRLGETRNVSIREAEGEYVLLQLDADDRYGDGITDFVTIYHQIERALDYEFYLKGEGINMAPRDFLVERGPYRNLAVGGEDRDLWRRLLDEGVLRWLDHEQFWEEIGYEKDLSGRIQRDLTVKTCDFQAGISPFSYVRWSVENRSLPLLMYDLVTIPYAYVNAISKPSYETAARFRRKGALERTIEEVRATLPELAERENVEVELSELSENGRRIFWPKTGGAPEDITQDK